MLKSNFLNNLNQWMTPERSIALRGIGQGLSQMAHGQPVNLSQSHNALAQRQQEREQRKALEQSGILSKFTPEQQAILAQMPPAAAQKVIAEAMFSRPKDNRTDDMREYELARSQGFGGTFTDYMIGLRRAGSTQINNNLGNNGIDYGQPPTDMAWVRGQDGRVQLDDRGAPMAAVIRGSKTDQQQTQSLIEQADGAISQAESDQANEENAGRTNSVVLEDIQRTQARIENAPWYDPATGFVGNIFKNVGGTTAADVKALTDTVRANIGFDRLSAMRAASPTGGALGNVTERELGQLQAVLGSLEQSQSESQMMENLDRLERIYSEIIRKASAYPNASEFGFDIDIPTGASDPNAVPPNVDPGLWEHMTPEERALWQ